MKGLFWCFAIALVVTTNGCLLSKPLIEPPLIDDALLRVAFGSCNKQDKDQSYWDAVEARQPDVWVWAGDIIYGDTNNKQELQRKYSAFKKSPRYARFLESCRASGCKVVGVWDDHDFGGNNLMGGDSCKAKLFDEFPWEDRKKLLLDFLDEPCASERRNRIGGVYTAYNFDKDGVRIRLILLDLRYDRSPPKTSGRMMNDQQWEWLTSQLSDEAVKVHLIVSSTQVLRESTGLIGKDTWAMYPEERERLLKLIGERKAHGAILLSGDIHGGEISELRREDANNFEIDYPLYEVTSSGLTHVRSFFPWTNKYQLGFTPDKNFGEIDIVKHHNGSVTAVATIFSVDGAILLRKNIRLE